MSCVARHRLVPILVGVLLALAVVSPALADGDPASDFLITQPAFLPFDANIDKAHSAQLLSLLAAAKKAGFQIRVAVIAKPYDLGSVPVLYRKPARYAQFLGQELFYWYKGEVLVVMPNGFGVYKHGPAPAADRALVGGSPGAWHERRECARRGGGRSGAEARGAPRHRPLARHGDRSQLVDQERSDRNRRRGGRRACAAGRGPVRAAQKSGSGVMLRLAGAIALATLSVVWRGLRGDEGNAGSGRSAGRRSRRHGLRPRSPCTTRPGTRQVSRLGRATTRSSRSSTRIAPMCAQWSRER